MWCLIILKTCVHFSACTNAVPRAMLVLYSLLQETVEMEWTVACVSPSVCRKGINGLEFEEGMIVCVLTEASNPQK